MALIRTYGWEKSGTGRNSRAVAGMKVAGMKIPVIKITPASSVRGAAPRAWGR